MFDHFAVQHPDLLHKLCLTPSCLFLCTAIRKEIADIEEGRMDREVNPLKVSLASFFFCTRRNSYLHTFALYVFMQLLVLTPCGVVQLRCLDGWSTPF